MKKYNTIAELSRDEINLKDGQIIMFRGEKLIYHKETVNTLLSTKDNEELDLGGMVEEDFNQLRMRYGLEDVE